MTCKALGYVGFPWHGNPATNNGLTNKRGRLTSNDGQQVLTDVLTLIYPVIRVATRFRDDKASMVTIDI